MIVFGSSGAKNVPDGFSYDQAWEQIVQAMQIAAPIAAEHGITIVIEPLNKKEANIVLTGAEGLKLAREIDRPSVQLLIDYYHMALEGESPDILLEGTRRDPAHAHLDRAGPHLSCCGGARLYAVLCEPEGHRLRRAGSASRQRRRTSRSDAVASLAVLKQLAS